MVECYILIYLSYKKSLNICKTLQYYSQDINYYETVKKVHKKVIKNFHHLTTLTLPLYGNQMNRTSQTHQQRWPADNRYKRYWSKYISAIFVGSLILLYSEQEVVCQHRRNNLTTWCNVRYQEACFLRFLSHMDVGGTNTGPTTWDGQIDRIWLVCLAFKGSFITWVPTLKRRVSSLSFVFALKITYYVDGLVHFLPVEVNCSTTAAVLIVCERLCVASKINQKKLNKNSVYVQRIMHLWQWMQN